MQFIFEVTTEDDDKLSSSIMVFLLPFHLYFSLSLCFHLRRFFMFYVYPGVFIGLCLCYQFLSVSIFPSSPVFLSPFVSFSIFELSLFSFSPTFRSHLASLTSVSILYFLYPLPLLPFSLSLLSCPLFSSLPLSFSLPFTLLSFSLSCFSLSSRFTR